MYMLVHVLVRGCCCVCVCVCAFRLVHSCASSCCFPKRKLMLVSEEGPTEGRKTLLQHVVLGIVDFSVRGDKIWSKPTFEGIRVLLDPSLLEGIRFCFLALTVR